MTYFRASLVPFSLVICFGWGWGWGTQFAFAATAASTANSSLCFDFNRPILKPLSPPQTQSPSAPLESLENSAGNSPDHSKDESKLDRIFYGPHPNGGGWSTAQGKIHQPISRVLERLQDQTTLKNPKDCDLSFTHEKREGLLDFQTVDITIHPFPLVSIQWQEQWAYAIAEGTPQQPRRVVISYQKTSGTSHIRRFCGSISLTNSGTASTEIAIYEETDATRRSPKDIAKGHQGTLRTLRELLAQNLKSTQTATTD